MRLAITDACIFIDLIDLKITSQFFQLELEVHTSNNVWDELDEDAKELLSAYRSVDKLTLHYLDEEAEQEIETMNFPKRLSRQDQTVIYLGKKLEAMILSSDKAVRNFAKSISVEYHGMFWIFDQFVDQQLLNSELAASKLRSLLMGNLMYRDNVELWKEANKRFKIWEE